MQKDWEVHNEEKNQSIEQTQKTQMVALAYILFFFFLASLIAQLVKSSPAMQETLARFLGQEDPLETG